MKNKILIIFTIVLVGSIFLIYFSSIKNTKEENLNNESKNTNIKKEENSMENFQKNIKISINGTSYGITLDENPTTIELVKRLPLEITMKELNENEKYYYFDEVLPSNSTKVGKINTGDIMLYGDDCLVLFYESFETPYSYTKIGKITNPASLKDKVGSGNIKVEITKWSKESYN